MTDDEILRRRAATLARPVAHDEEHSVRDLALRVEIAGQYYAFAVTEVTRVIVPLLVTAVPHSAPILLGIVADRGEVIPVFDAHVWLGKPRRSLERPAPVLILGSERVLGLAVDKVHDTISILRLPDHVGDSWLVGITDKGELIVDVQRLLQAPAFVTGENAS